MSGRSIGKTSDASALAEIQNSSAKLTAELTPASLNSSKNITPYLRATPLILLSVETSKISWMLDTFFRVQIVLSSNIPDNLILSCVLRSDPNLDFAFSKLFTGTMANIFKYSDP